MNLRSKEPWVQLVVLAAIWLAFVLSLHTSRAADGHFIPFLTPRVGQLGLLGLLALMAGTVLARLVFQWLQHPAPSRAAVQLLQPTALLAVYALGVFVLPPLGCPPFITGILMPRFLLPLIGLLCAVRGAGLVRACPPMAGWITWVDAHCDARWLARLLFVLVLGLYGWADWQDSRRDLLVGDEQHYLFIMESLQRYHSADLTRLVNDREFSDGVQLVVPHKSGQSREGTLYDVHHVGLPLLLWGPHALLGYPGVILFFNLVAALLAANIFLFAYELTGHKWTALLVALLMAIACPIGFYFRCVYPDLVAALGLLYGARVVLAHPQRTLRFEWLALLAGALLPWLHVKYFVLAGMLFLLFIATARNRFKTFVVASTLYALSIAPMLFFFHHAFGSFAPSAPYGDSNPPVSIFFWRGAAGLLLDRNHGLLAFAPVYLFAMAGLPVFCRRRPRAAWLLALIAMPAFLIFASHWMWWGGPCPPGRFLLPLIPLVAPLLVYALREVRGAAYTLALWSAIGLTLFISAWGWQLPGELEFHQHVARLSFLSWLAYPWFPDFFYHHTENVPAASFVFLGFWCILPLLLLLKGWNTRAPAKAAYSGVVVALSTLIILLLPGLLSWLNQRIVTYLPPTPTPGEAWREQNPMSARRHYQLYLFLWPRLRAGGPLHEPLARVEVLNRDGTRVLAETAFCVEDTWEEIHNRLDHCAGLDALWRCTLLAPGGRPIEKATFTATSAPW